MGYEPTDGVLFLCFEPVCRSLSPILGYTVNLKPLSQPANEMKKEGFRALRWVGYPAGFRIALANSMNSGVDLSFGIRTGTQVELPPGYESNRVVTS